MNYLEELNENQYKGATTDEQYVRIIAGAGSGKTRVLTYRIAYLLDELKVNPYSILAITFTNKVANEMKNRLIDLVPIQGQGVMIKTYHSFAAMFLRREISILDYPQNFTILDEEDQLKLIKDIASSMGYKKSDPIVKKAPSYISGWKLKELYPDDVKLDKNYHPDTKVILEIYEEYENKKEKMFSLDFDDLLLKTNYILKNYPSIRMRWQQKLSHILVDEFQDTNDTEYKLIKYLMTPSTCLYLVGDPDQTIYTWRGANQNIILDINKDFPGVETIILDRNYRSTQNILNSANRLIANNKYRVKKNLYTEGDVGEKIVVRKSSGKQAEADFVALEIKKLHDVSHYKYNDIVVLYRSNYITMEFEAAFTSRNIPYRIYGGQKFYQRREIKDILAYFHLIVNKKDDVSFERIMNVPRRGIGDTTLTTLKREAKDFDLSLYEYIEEIDSHSSEASTKAINSLKALVKIINITRENIYKDEETFSKILEDLVDSIDYYSYLKKEDDGDDRIDNVKALFSDLRHYMKNNPDASFDSYLQNISLLSAQDEIVDGDFVNMMTVHTAKGLEFPIVFIVRFNQQVFPNQRALTDNGFQALEEERRLAYVAMTRAKKKLYISYASDYDYISGGYLSPSQFIKESGNQVSESYYDNDFNSPRTNRRSYSFNDGPNSSFQSDVYEFKPAFVNENNGINDWKVGDKVCHTTLGNGVVIKVDEDGIIEVDFENHGVKVLLGSHKSLSRGD